MNVVIDRIKLLFLGLFVLSVGVIWGYHALYVWPREACESRGDWWDDRDRQCAIPMPIWTFTHRLPGQRAAPTGQAAPAAASRAAKP
jgi:hypothetical protein